MRLKKKVIISDCVQMKYDTKLNIYSALKSWQMVSYISTARNHKQKK